VITRPLKWLKTKLSHPPKTDESHKHSAAANVGADRAQQSGSESALESASADEFDHHVRDIKQGREFPMPDIYASGDTFKQPRDEFVEEESLETGESMGFDLYDTGCVDMSKARNSRSED